ncbi:MAG TPA: hypothetical protein VEH84_04830, partial [Alphaproteobacteria bacterium]|nr:hypothetical protein [Alphaproteobacteria bacterium]
MGAVRKFITPWVLLATVGTSILQGCATPGVTVSADDVCRAERAELKAVEDFFIQSAVQGAIGGAVAGGLAGAL